MRPQTTTISTDPASFPRTLQHQLENALGEHATGTATRVEVHRTELRRNRVRYTVRGGAAAIGATRIAALELGTATVYESGFLAPVTFNAANDPGPAHLLDELLREMRRRRGLDQRLVAFDLAGAVIIATGQDTYQVHPAGTPESAVTVTLPVELTASHIAEARFARAHT